MVKSEIRVNLLYQLTKNNFMQTEKFTNNHYKTVKEAKQQMLEIGKTIGVFQFALNLMYSLKFETITNTEYNLIAGDLYLYCAKNNIETKNEIVSLF